MSALDGLTVCVTSFQRPDRLAACLESVHAAGIRRVAIASAAPDATVMGVLHANESRGWLSYDVATTSEDIGCNNTWMVAAYLARGKRVLLLHDDDTLAPEFGKAYTDTIAPALDRRDAGFVSWNAALRHDDGSTEPCPYWEGPSTLMPSKHLLKVVDNRLGFSLSPVVSVLNRAILIHACKEAAATLTSNRSLLRPGMLLGTEILVYVRHIQAYRRWLYLDQVLSFYGSHPESGTVQAQKGGVHGALIDGYNAARDQGQCRATEPSPRLLLVYSAYEPKDDRAKERQQLARFSWSFHFNNAEMIEVPYRSDGLPKIRAILDHACALALPEDIVVYANSDAGLTTHAVERIIAGVARGHGVTCCGNHNVDEPRPGRLYKSVTNHKQPGGIDVIALTPQWWKLHRELLPDMYIGREGWDTCFATLAEEWADGGDSSPLLPSQWENSKAHTADVCWHQEHLSEWKTDRMSETQQYNRRLAREFLGRRTNHQAAAALKVLK